MTTRFTPPIQKVSSNTLGVMPGALLYFHENGTTTLKTVYQDKNKIASHTNPVAADAYGNFLPIFLDGTYRVTLKSSVGVTQPGWPVDNYGGDNTGAAFDDYSSITAYSIGEIVTASNGLRFTSLQNANLNNDPLTSPTFWQEIRLTLAWNATSIFAALDRVFYDGYQYISLQASNTNHTPSSNSAWWKKIKEYDVWNNATTYGASVYVFEGEDRYISVQAANTNHQPSTDTSYTWWKPDWAGIDAITKAVTKTGGGALTLYKPNEITDSGTYTLPLANSVPADTIIQVFKSERYRANQPIINASGANTITYSGGTDTGITFDYAFVTMLIFKSNGSNTWSI